MSKTGVIEHFGKPALQRIDVASGSIEGRYVHVPQLARSIARIVVGVVIVAVAAATPAGNSSAGQSPASKKGVDVWAFEGVGGALVRSHARWFLDWSTVPGDIPIPNDVQFVPMIRAASNVNATTLAQARRFGPDLLTFNEPDLSSQANMSVAEALALWPQLESTGLELASPAVAAGAADPGGWLDEFMRGVAIRNYRVDFIALHWYGSDFRTAPAVSELKSYLAAVHDRYPSMPIWLTEYSLINFRAAPRYPTASQQVAFVKASVSMLDRLSYVARFAWFALPTAGADSTGLFRPGAKPTPAGRAFAHAP